MLGGPLKVGMNNKLSLWKKKVNTSSMEIMIKSLVKDPLLIDQGDSCSINKKGKHIYKDNLHAL